MNCEKCTTGTMAPRKIFRLSGCLVALGFVLLIPAIGGILLAGLFAVVSTFATGAGVKMQQDTVHSNAVYNLKSIEGIPPTFVALFETNHLEAAAQLTQLPTNVQARAELILNDHQLRRGTSAAAGGVAAVFGGVFTLILFAISIPTLIVGFLLVLRKKVWHCQACGYVFERS